MVLERQLPHPEVTALLSQQESHFLDFKDVRITPGKLSKGVSAFANASGGELFVGISELEEADGQKKLSGPDSTIRNPPMVYFRPSKALLP